MSNSLKCGGYSTLKRRITMAKKQVATYAHHEPIVYLPLEQAKEVLDTINGFSELVPLCNKLETAIRGKDMTPKEKTRAMEEAIKNLKATLVILNKVQ